MKIFKAHISLSIFRAKELEGLKKGGKQWVGESERSGVVASQAFCCSSIGLHESAPAGLSWTILSWERAVGDSGKSHISVKARVAEERLGAFCRNLLCRSSRLREGGPRLTQLEGVWGPGSIPDQQQISCRPSKTSSGSQTYNRTWLIFTKQQLGKHCEMIECEWIWDLGPTGRQLWRIKRHRRLNHSSRSSRIQQWKAERTRGPRSGWWAIAAFWVFDRMRKNCCLHIFKVKNFILAQKDLFSLNGPTWSIGKKNCSAETMIMALIAGASLCHRQPPRLECRSCHGLLCNPHPTGFPLTF